MIRCMFAGLVSNRAASATHLTGEREEGSENLVSGRLVYCQFEPSPFPYQQRPTKLSSSGIRKAGKDQDGLPSTSLNFDFTTFLLEPLALHPISKLQVELVVVCAPFCLSS